MSWIGRWIDNGPMEASLGAFKSEMYYLKSFLHQGELTSAMEDYIHFQNTERLQENRKGLSHLEYRTKAF